MPQYPGRSAPERRAAARRTEPDIPHWTTATRTAGTAPRGLPSGRSCGNRAGSTRWGRDVRLPEHDVKAVIPAPGVSSPRRRGRPPVFMRRANSSLSPAAACSAGRRSLHDVRGLHKSPSEHRVWTSLDETDKVAKARSNWLANETVTPVLMGRFQRTRLASTPRRSSSAFINIPVVVAPTGNKGVFMPSPQKPRCRCRRASRAI